MTMRIHVETNSFLSKFYMHIKSIIVKNIFLTYNLNLYLNFINDLYEFQDLQVQSFENNCTRNASINVYGLICVNLKK